MKNLKTTLRIVVCLVLVAVLALAFASCKKNKKNHEHNYVASVTGATCGQPGFTTYTCECGDSYVGDPVTVEHDLVAHKGLPPTCTEAGYADYNTCSRCDYTTYRDLPATGHNPVEKITRFPTTLYTGIKTTMCEGCGECYKDEEIEAITVSLPDISPFLRSFVGDNYIDIKAEDTEIVLIKEIDGGSEAGVEKNFIAIKLANFVIDGKSEVLSAHLSLDVGVATYESLEDDAEPTFTRQLVVDVIVNGDDVSVSVTEDDNAPANSEYSVSDLFYRALAQRYGINYEILVEGYYLLGKMTEYLPIAEGVINWLATIEIPEGKFDIVALVQLVGGELISTDNNGNYSINISGLAALVAEMGDMTIADFVDAQYGAGTAQSVKDFILSVPTSKIRDIANAAARFSENSGVPIDQVYALINYAVCVSTGVDFNIESEIASRYNMTVAQVVAQLSGDPSLTPAEIDAMALSMIESLEEGIDLIKNLNVDQIYNLYMFGDIDEEFSVTDNLVAVLDNLDTMVEAKLHVTDGVVDNAELTVDGLLTVTYADDQLKAEVLLPYGKLVGIVYEDAEGRGIDIKGYNEEGNEMFNGIARYRINEDGKYYVVNFVYGEYSLLNASCQIDENGEFEYFNASVWGLHHDHRIVEDAATGEIIEASHETKHYQMLNVVLNSYGNGLYHYEFKLNNIVSHGGMVDNGDTYIDSSSSELTEIFDISGEVAVENDYISFDIANEYEGQIVFDASFDLYILETGYDLLFNVSIGDGEILYLDADYVNDVLSVNFRSNFVGEQLALVLYSDPDSTDLVVHKEGTEWINYASTITADGRHVDVVITGYIDRLIVEYSSGETNDDFVLSYEKEGDEIFKTSANVVADELVYLDIIVNEAVDGKVDGLDGDKHLLNIVTFIYSKANDGSFTVDFVGSDIYSAPSDKDSASNSGSEVEVQEESSVIYQEAAAKLQVAYNGSDELLVVIDEIKVIAFKVTEIDGGKKLNVVGHDDVNTYFDITLSYTETVEDDVVTESEFVVDALIGEMNIDLTYATTLTEKGLVFAVAGKELVNVHCAEIENGYVINYAFSDLSKITNSSETVYDAENDSYSYINYSICYTFSAAGKITVVVK